MAALGFNRSLAIGEKVERELADLCTEYGWNIHKMTSGFGSNVPLLQTKQGKIKAPDIQLTRLYHPTVAIECKAKQPYSGSYIYDCHRIEYARDWSQKTQTPVLFVFKNEPYGVEDPHNWRFCSLHKLYNNHTYIDPTSLDRDGNICPTYLYDTELFLPFKEFFLAGSVITKTEVRFFNFEDGKEVLL